MSNCFHRQYSFYFIKLFYTSNVHQTPVHTYIQCVYYLLNACVVVPEQLFHEAY